MRNEENSGDHRDGNGKRQKLQTIMQKRTTGGENVRSKRPRKFSLPLY